MGRQNWHPQVPDRRLYHHSLQRHHYRLKSSNLLLRPFQRQTCRRQQRRQLQSSWSSETSVRYATTSQKHRESETDLVQRRTGLRVSNASSGIIGRFCRQLVANQYVTGVTFNRHCVRDDFPKGTAAADLETVSSSTAMNLKALGSAFFCRQAVVLQVMHTRLDQ